SWLALRAVEQQSKKLDLLEGRETPPLTPQSGDIPTGSAPTQDAPVAHGSARTESDAPQPRSTMRSAPKAKQSAPTTATAPAAPAAPAAEQAQPLPPPIDIRPAPTPRVPRAGQQAAPRPAQPAGPRSLSEILFGR